MDPTTRMIGPVLIFVIIAGTSVCEELPRERIENFQSTGKKHKGPGKIESRFFGFDGNNMGQLFPGSGNNQGPQSGGTPTNPGGTGFPANSQFYPGVQNQNPPFPADTTGIDDAKNYPQQNNPGIVQQYPNTGNFGPSNQNQGNFGRPQMPGVNQGNFGGFRPGQNTGAIPQSPNQGNFNFPQQRPGQGSFGGMQYPSQANGFPMQYPNQNSGIPMQYPSQNSAGRLPLMQNPNQGNFGGFPLHLPNQGNIGRPQLNTQFPNQGSFSPTQTQYPNQGNFGGLPQNMQYPNQGNFGATQTPETPYPNQGNFGSMPPQYPNQGNLGGSTYPGGSISQVPIPIPDQNISGGFTSAPDFYGQQLPSDGGFGSQNNQGSGQTGDGTVDSLIPEMPNPDSSMPEGPSGMDEATAILGRPVIVPQEASGDKIIFPGSPDTPSQRQCVQDCQTTTEYNPVCGTNNVTYINPGKFVCARNCGVVVYVHRRGRCPDTTPTSRPIIG